MPPWLTFNTSYYIKYGGKHRADSNCLYTSLAYNRYIKKNQRDAAWQYVYL